MDSPTRVDDAITIDEVGIRTGRYRHLFLKSSYQTIFGREGRHLAPFAAEGLVTPLADGEPRPPEELFAAAADGDRLFVETMCRTLHLRNFENIGAPWLRLFFNFDPLIHRDHDASIRDIGRMGCELAALGLEPSRLVCEITETEAVDRVSLASLAAEMRRLGIRIAIDDFGVGHSTLERVHLVRPDIVKLDRRLIGELAEVPGAVRLLASLIAGLHELGSRVLAEGIETARQLEIALDAGVDYYQGYLLSRPALAGTIFRLDPVDIQSLIRPQRKVVPLRA